MENILEVKNLCKQYQDFQLNNVSFTLPRGMIMGFVGENGAGKTTTIKAILNVINYSHGEITLFGQPTKQAPASLHEDIAVVYDDCSFPGFYKLKDIERLFKNSYKNWDSNKFHELIREFNLPENKKIMTFSRGMKMKVQLIVALAHHPKLLLLDEPTSGLDPIVRDEILDLFLSFIQDESCSILFSSHITSDIEKIADYVTFIHKGQIIFTEEKDQLLENQGILKVKTDVFQQLDKSECIAYRKNMDHYEVLIKDRKGFKKTMPDAIIDRATLDEIMLLHVKGERL